VGAPRPTRLAAGRLPQFRYSQDTSASLRVHRAFAAAT